MSLIAIALTGRYGTPMYLRDFSEDVDLVFDGWGQGELTDSELFGDDSTCEDDSKFREEKWPCLARYQFFLHSAFCQLEQVLAGGKWKTPGATGADACWIGFLCTYETFNAYGYVTTNSRYVALVEDSVAPENLQRKKSREDDLKMLFANVHRSYTEHLLNPFTIPNSKITSKRFDASVIRLARNFNGTNIGSY